MRRDEMPRLRFVHDGIAATVQCTIDGIAVAVQCTMSGMDDGVVEKDLCAHDGVLAMKNSLTVEDVMNFLTNDDKFRCISAPPIKPKANQVYLYKTSDAGKEGIIYFASLCLRFRIVGSLTKL